MIVMTEMYSKDQRNPPVKNQDRHESNSFINYAVAKELE